MIMKRMIVTRKDNKNVVILSEETYNNLMENVYVMGNKANYDWLMESKAQLENGHCVHMSLLRWRMNKVFTENGWADYTFWENVKIEKR